MNKKIKFWFSVFLVVVLFFSVFGLSYANSDYVWESVLSTDPASDITQNSTKLRGTVLNVMDLDENMQRQIVFFEYGENASNLNFVSSHLGSVNGSVAILVTNLKPNTKYYYRIVVDFEKNSFTVNSNKMYGGVLSFTTLSAGTLSNTTTTQNTPVSTTNTPQQEVRCPFGDIFNTITGARCTTFDNVMTKRVNTDTINTTITSTTQSPLGYNTNIVPMVKSVSVNLTLGNRGDSVSKLQAFLIEQNKGVKARSLANTGATGYFGLLTRSALAEFQASVGILPNSGYFGSITRAYIANHF